MLTTDLLRVRDDGKLIAPRYLKLEGKRLEGYLERAEALIALFHRHEHLPRVALNEAIADLVGDGTDLLLTRGLTKLLEDRSTFETVAVAPPEQVREIVFACAARHHPVVKGADAVHTVDRAGVLQQAADALTDLRRAQDQAAAAVTTDEVEAALYADLEDHQRLTTFKPVEPLGLLERYNLALAQAALIRASELRITLLDASPARYRQLFRFLKFYQLMHRVRRVGAGWELTLDGPMSLLKNTTRYGVQMALFLPALALCEGWTLEADLRWGPERSHRTFTLSDAEGLQSHYPNKGVWVTDEQKHLEERVAALNTDWAVAQEVELVDLGGRDILAPDLALINKKDKRVALLEIVGYWRKGWLEKKLEHLARFGPPNLILALSDRLQTDDDPLPADLPVKVYFFKGVILPKRILELADAVAR
jgi:predicted nuclease of restriction endonuclease-like RecB superfamily